MKRIEAEEFHEEFERLVHAQDLTSEAVARKLDVSRPTVERWMAREYSPHPLIAPIFLRELAK